MPEPANALPPNTSPDVSPDASPDAPFEATYVDGVLRPAVPLDLPPETRLTLRIAAQEASAVPPDVAPADAAPADAAPPVPVAETLPNTDDAPTTPRLWLLLPLAGAVALAVLGQTTMVLAGTVTWLGGLAYVLAALLFGLTLRYRDYRPLRHMASAPPDRQRWARAVAFLRQRSGRIGCLLVAGLLSGLHLYVLQLDPPLASYNWTFGLWLLAIGLYLLAVVPAASWRLRGDWRAWWREHGRVALLVAGLVVLAFGLRVWNVASIPPTLGGDEGSQGLEAMRVLEGDITNPFTTGWLGVPTMSFYFNALTIGPLGNTMFALRLPWTIIGALTVLVVFLLVRRLHGLTLALVTAALLATYHYHIHFSRLGSNQIADTLFVALALLFAFRGYDRRSVLDWTICGLIMGMSQFFYAGARFTVVVTVAVTGFLLLRDGVWPFLRTRWHEMLAVSGAALLSAAPMIQYALRFPSDYNARINQVGVIQSGWLEREVQVRGESAFWIMFDQFERAALAFNFYPDRNVWYGSPEPLMVSWEAALFLLGLLYATACAWDRRMFPFVAWWWGATLMGGMLTESPPSSQRLITIAAPAMFFVALVLVRAGQAAAHALAVQRPRRMLVPFLSAAVLVLAFVSVRWYFVDFTPMLKYGSYNGVVATSVGKYARDELDEDWRMYFFGPPRMYIGFGSIPYIAPDVPGTDILTPLTAPPTPELVPPDKHAAFIFLPERANELDYVRQAFPNGALEEIASPVPDRPGMLYLVYRVPRAQLEQRISYDLTPAGAYPTTDTAAGGAGAGAGLRGAAAVR